MTLGGLLGRMVACSLALLLAATIATWVASGDALRAFQVGAEQAHHDGSSDPLASFGQASERVGDVVWPPVRVALQVIYVAGAALLLSRTIARRRRRIRRWWLLPGRSDEASPEQVRDLFEAWHQQLQSRWWRRIPFGQPSLALELHAGRDPQGERIARLVVACPEGLERTLEAPLRACYPDARLVEHDEPVAALARVVRLKKRYPFIQRLRTPARDDPSVIDALLTELSELRSDAVVQYVLTPAPALFDRLSRDMFRAREHRLERARSRDDANPGLRSGVASRELEGGLSVQHRALFFAEIRVAAGSYGDCRAAAGVIRGASSSENRLVERYPRPFGLGPLYLRRLRRACGNVVPSWRRGVLATAELVGLWHVPAAALRTVRLERSPVPRAVAPTEVSRAPADALARDERGPVGIRPEDRTAGLGLVGGQGTGKTSLMCRTIAADVVSDDCAVIVLDPKSDLARKALSTIPRERTVHYLDFGAPEVGFNPLLAPGDAAMVADKLVEAFKDIHEAGDIRASSDRYLRQAAHAAIGASRSGALEGPPTLWHMYRLLLPSEDEFRDEVVRAIEPQAAFTETATFFGRDLPDDLRRAPTLTTGKLDAPRNKILRLLVESLDKVLRHPIQLSLDEVISRREVLIVDGRMGTFGADNCRVMMQFILSLIYGALQRQQQRPEAERARVALRVDEAHLVLNESFANAMATLRSAGLEVVAAWQYGAQIQDDKIRGGLMSLLRQRCMFSVGESDDARELTKIAMAAYSDSIRPDRDTRARLLFTPDTLLNLPNHHAICSWISGGARAPAFVAQTYPMGIDDELVEHHLAAQRARGGSVPSALPHPLGDLEPLYRVPPTGPVAPAPAEESATVPKSERDGGDPSPEAGAEAGPTPRGADTPDGARESGPASSADGAAGPHPRRVPGERRDASPDVVDHAPLGSPVPGIEPPESYIELALDHPTGLVWDSTPPQPPDAAPAPDRRQLEALAALHELRFIYGSQLARRFWPEVPQRTVRRHLGEMFKAGWVRRFQITASGGGQKQRIYTLAKPGFELAQRHRGRRGPYIDPEAAWREPQIEDARRVIHDLHATGWLFAFEQLATPVIRGWSGPRSSRVLPPSRRDHGQWVTITANEIPLGGGRRIRDLAIDEFKPVEPDVTIEIALHKASPPQRFDLLVELDRSGRASRNVEKFRRYDALLTAWGRTHERYKLQGEPPIVVFVVNDEPKAREFVDAADDVVTGAVVVPGTGAEHWEYPGRERMFFVCERDAHIGTLRGYRMPRHPRAARAAIGGDRRRSRTEPQPEQVALLERRLLDRVGAERPWRAEV